MGIRHGPGAVRTTILRLGIARRPRAGPEGQRRLRCRAEVTKACGFRVAVSSLRTGISTRRGRTDTSRAMQRAVNVSQYPIIVAMS